MSETNATGLGARTGNEESSSEKDVQPDPAESVGLGGQYAKLTAFQRDILWILSEGPKYGLAIKRTLEDLYNEEVNHGRLYPNLDQLAEKGLLEKGEIDDRTNSYELTDTALSELEDRQSWERGEEA